MSLFRTIVFVAALAGLASGIGMTGLQLAWTVPLIQKAERYEAAAERVPHVPAHTHADAAPSGEAAAAPHRHGADAWEPTEGQRPWLTALSNIVTAIGFALLLVTASEIAGGLSGWRQGIFWGLAGFATFSLAPGLGLPPELPAAPAADLGPRQIWWVATAAATAGGLALLAFKRSLPAATLALVLVVGPHVLGAPKPASFDTPLPPGLIQDFAVAAIVSGLVFWTLLGGVAGFLRSRHPA